MIIHHREAADGDCEDLCQFFKAVPRAPLSRTMRTCWWSCGTSKPLRFGPKWRRTWPNIDGPASPTTDSSKTTPCSVRFLSGRNWERPTPNGGGGGEPRFPRAERSRVDDRAKLAAERPTIWCAGVDRTDGRPIAHRAESPSSGAATQGKMNCSENLGADFAGGAHTTPNPR